MISTQSETKTPPVSGPSRPRRRRWVAAIAAVAVVAAAVPVLALTPILGSLGNVSIVAGWFPVFLFWMTVAVCVLAVVVRRDVLKEFAFGIPIGIALVVLLFGWLHFT